MDIKIQRKRWTLKRILVAATAGGILIWGLGSFYLTSGKSTLKVDTRRLEIGEVKTGTFHEFVPINGLVTPQTTIYLDAIEGGRVEEQFAEDGALVKKGQPLLRLSNTDLELSLVNQQTSVYNLLTQMQIAKNAAQQNTTTKLNQKTEVENGLKETKRIYELDQKLYGQQAIGRQEYLQAENNYNYQLARMKLTEDILRQDAQSNAQQMAQARQSYQGSQGALNVMRKKVADLVVRAPIDGRLTSLDAEIGQNKNKGERLGQVDAVTGQKIRADIDEHYVTRVITGQSAEALYNGRRYKLIVSKVYSQINNGHFSVDMQFVGTAPSEIRRGQTLQIRLSLGEDAQALLLPKGGFYQQTGGNWVFKVSDDGKRAYKTAVVLGRQSPEYYEVQNGLHPGDRVIVSGYDNFNNAQELILTK